MSDHGFDLSELSRKLGGHSVFAPSASAMWLLCSGSLIPNLLAEDNAGIDAAYGTVAHGVGERWLQTGYRPDDLVGTVEIVDEGHEKFLILIDDDMLDHVERYVNWCEDLPGVKFVEQRVDFSQLTPIPKQGGTADHIACLPRKMVITDLKMGKGVKVYATNNSQALLYALGSFYRWDWAYDFQEIEIRIAQPRLDHFDTWTVTREYLLEFAEYVRERAALAWQPDAPRTAGEKQCQWCKVKSTCANFATYMAEFVEGAFEDLDGHMSDEQLQGFQDRLNDPFDDFELQPVSIHTLNSTQMAQIIKMRRAVENWFKSLEDEIEKMLQAGQKVVGYKLVEGRANRFFNGGVRAAETLEMLTGVPAETFLEHEVISPAKVEVILKKHGFKGKRLEDVMSRDYLVIKPRGKPVMAPAHDRRKELHVGVDDEFEDLDGDDL
jgi:hypothetical protein